MVLQELDRSVNDDWFFSGTCVGHTTYIDDPQQLLSRQFCEHVNGPSLERFAEHLCSIGDPGFLISQFVLLFSRFWHFKDESARDRPDNVRI